MSKNLTRKGLAFGAVVALGTTLFAGAPAQAASVLFAPTTGTGNSLVAGETFSLTASLSSDLPAANSTQLKFKVANTNAVAATVTLNGKTILAAGTYDADDNGTYYKPVALDSSVGGTTAGSELASSTTSAVFGVTNTSVDLSNATATDVVVGGVASTATNPTTISIESAADTTSSYTVTAWLDANNNAVIDGGELSADQTVNFVKIADAGVVTTLTKPTVDDEKFKATISFASAINVSQLTTGNYQVALGKYVSGTKTLATANTVYTAGPIAGEAVAYDSTNKNLKVYVAGADGATVTTDSGDFVAGATYSAQAVFTPGTNALIGTEVTQVVSTPVATGAADPTSTVSNDVAADSTNFLVRSGVKSVAVSSALTKADGDDAGTDPDSVGAGVAAVVTVTETIDSTTTITVGGKTLTSTTGSTTFDAVTGADGKIAFTIASSTGKAGDIVSVSVKTSGVAATSTVSYTWTAATIPAAASDAGLINLRATGVTSTAKAGTYTLEYALVDSFGALVKATGYRVSVSAPGTGTDATTSTKQVEFSGGKASVSLTDGSTSTGTVTATATVQVWDATAGNWVGSLSTSLLTSARTLAATVHVISNSAAALTATAGSGTAIETKDFVSGDTRIDEGTITVPSWVSANNTISGALTDSVGGAVKGKAVTVSAAGVLFSSNGIYSLGSITVNTDGSGEYTVNTFSHKSGKVTFTVVSEGLTKTADVTYAAAASNTGSSLTVTGADKIASGKTLVFTVKLVDKFGNAIDNDSDDNGTADSNTSVTLTYDGPGLIVGSLPTTLPATGLVTVRVLVGSGDSGLASLSATYAGGAAGTTDDITASKSVLVGVSASVSAGSKKATATVKNAAGLTVTLVSGTKSVTKIATSDNYKVSLTKLTAGKKTVKVYVNDVLVASKSVTVKK